MYQPGPVRQEGPADPSSPRRATPLEPPRTLRVTCRSPGDKFLGLGGCQRGSYRGHPRASRPHSAATSRPPPGTPFLSPEPASPQQAGFCKVGAEPSRAIHSLKTFSLLPWAQSSHGQGPRRIMRVRYQQALLFLVLSPSQQPIRGPGNQAGARKLTQSRQGCRWEGWGDGNVGPANLTLPCPCPCPVCLSLPSPNALPPKAPGGSSSVSQDEQATGRARALIQLDKGQHRKTGLHCRGKQTHWGTTKNTRK